MTDLAVCRPRVSQTSRGTVHTRLTPPASSGIIAPTLSGDTFARYTSSKSVGGVATTLDRGGFWLGPAKGKKQLGAVSQEGLKLAWWHVGRFFHSFAILEASANELFEKLFNLNATFFLLLGNGISCTNAMHPIGTVIGLSHRRMIGGKSHSHTR
jgi:hypothetical protein